MIIRSRNRVKEQLRNKDLNVGGGSYSGGSKPIGSGGSFLDKYFTYDEANDALIANVNLASEKEVAAYIAGSQLPSIFDAMPIATETSLGVVKIGARLSIDINGILSADIQDGGGGTTILGWGDLTGRPVWLQPETLSGFEAAHAHTWGQITEKPSTFNPSAHLHTWGEISVKPSTFAPSAHNHTIADITSLQSALDGKATTAHVHTIANVTGLQSALDGKSNTSHTHNYLPATGTAVNSNSLGGVVAADYTRRNISENITGSWAFNGFLAIGKSTAATEALDVVGNIKAYNYQDAQQWIVNIKGGAVTSGNYVGLKLLIGYGGETNKWAGIAAVAESAAANTTGMALYTGSVNGTSEKVRIDAHGRVGIGKNNPSQVLDVVGNILTSQRFMLSAQWSIGTEGNDMFFYNSAGVKKAKIDQNGNLTMAGEVTAFGLI